MRHTCRSQVKWARIETSMQSHSLPRVQKTFSNTPENFQIVETRPNWKAILVQINATVTKAPVSLLQVTPRCEYRSRRRKRSQCKQWWNLFSVDAGETTTCCTYYTLYWCSWTRMFGANCNCLVKRIIARVMDALTTNSERLCCSDHFMLCVWRLRERETVATNNLQWRVRKVNKPARVNAKEMY